jgi:diaminopimelate decarboxylase
MDRVWYENIVDQVEKSDKIFSRGRPFFLYNPSVAIENILTIRKTWSGFSQGSTRIFFSVKANPNPRLLKELESAVDGYDVSSEMEFDLLLRLGIGGKRITLSGPAKTERLLQRAIKEGVYGIHFDSEEEYFAHRKMKEASLKQSLCRLTLRLAHGKAGFHKVGFSDDNLSGILKKINDQS